MARRKRDTNEGSQPVSKGAALGRAFPSSPMFPPTHAVYCRYPASLPEGSDKRLVVMNFCSMYAAKKFVDSMIQGNTFKWQKARVNLGYKVPDTIVTEDDLEIRCPQGLEEIMEYEYANDAEREWQLPEQYERQASLIRRLPGTPANLEFDGEMSGADIERAAGVRGSTKPKREKKEPKAKVDKTGLISVSDIAEQMKIEPRDARQALRKSKMEKPTGGWLFAPGEVEKIKAIIKAGLK